MKKNIFIIIFIILITIPALLPLLQRGFFVSDDGEWMIVRFSAFHQALRDGQIPVRFLGRLNYGHGYPVANFLYPGFMYIAEIPKLLGFGFVDSIKMILGASMISSMIFVYFWLSRFFDKTASFLGSLFYLYMPYHLFDLYKRGSIGEVLALSVIPFILWQIERKSLFFSSLGIAFLILSHNTLALLFVPLIIIYLILSKKVSIFPAKQDFTLQDNFQFSILLGLGISSFFWIPAIFELQYTPFSKTSVSNFNEYFANYKLIGISTIIVFLLTFIFFLTQKIKFVKYKLTLLLFIIGILSLFFSTSISNTLWKILPVSFIQFPFRFLSLTILCSSFLLASSLSILQKKTKIIIGVSMLLITLIFSKPFLTQIEFFDKGDSFYSTNEGTTTVKDEYMPIWVKEKPLEHFKDKVEIIEGNASIYNLSSDNKKISITIDALSDGKVRVNTIFYPGWKAFINDKEVKIDYSNEKGVMDIAFKKNKNYISLVFIETPVRLLSDIISLISIIILIGISSLKFYKR